MEKDIIMLCEINQTQKTIFHVFSHMWNLYLKRKKGHNHKRKTTVGGVKQWEVGGEYDPCMWYIYAWKGHNETHVNFINILESRNSKGGIRKNGRGATYDQSRL
jgi:hypothetical protein